MQALTATDDPMIRDRIRTLLFNGGMPTEALAVLNWFAVRCGVLPTLGPFHAIDNLILKELLPLVAFGPTRSPAEQAARILR